MKKVLIESPIKSYCGIGAGGVQFAYGKAEINDGWIADWYKNKGYKVSEIVEVEEVKANKKK